MPRLPWFGFLILAPLALASACRLGGSARGDPPPAAAARALAEAREAWRLRPPDWRGQVLRDVERAAALAPEWVAPQRLLDDLARDGLLGPAALARRTAEAAAQPSDARGQYLVGRLQGLAGVERLERAAALDPSLSWAHHGLAWSLFQAGRAKRALRHGRRALALARGSHELGFFVLAQARYLRELDRAEEAIELLRETLADGRLEEPERTECRVALARQELEDDKARERGFWRGLDLLDEPGLSADERLLLGQSLLDLGVLGTQVEARTLVLAALTEDLPGAAALRSRALLEAHRPELARAALLEADEGALDPVLERTLALRRGDARAALENWRSRLPARVLDQDGLPLEPALRRLVEAARVASRATGAASGRAAFGEALLEAGWFDEAVAWAEASAFESPTVALDLHRRASAGQALMADLVEVFGRIDRRKPAFDVARGAGREIQSLDELLELLEPRFARFHASTGGAAEDLVHSPRLSYGGLAQIVHPGPRFSSTDAAAGRGVEGAPVPGLAAELDLLGRFGLFGVAPGGGGPDGAVLRRLGVEWRSGERLGVPFSGTVVWCEGSDLPSRPARQGSEISGAALHEGYWIDVENVRSELPRVLGLEREFLEERADELDSILDQEICELPAGAGPNAAAEWIEPLGEDRRVLLALMRDRARAGRPVGQRLTLDEFLDVTALHEEGHLTDRTRFLPLTKHWTSALALAIRAGLTPRAIARRLEYRAQLVALCEAADPRLPLADCLSAAERTGGVLAHGDAYRELVEDLLQLLLDDKEHFPTLDLRRPLVHQLHRLTADEVRVAGRALARREGLLR